MVIIEMTNCDDICKVFIDLGVPHVVSFNQGNLNNTQVLDSNIDSSFKIFQAQIYMRDFLLNFYPNIMQCQTISKALQKAFKMTASPEPETMKISYNHLTIDEQRKRDKVYDVDEVDERKVISKGPMCDISSIKPETNIKSNPSCYLLRTLSRLGVSDDDDNEDFRDIIVF